MDTEPLPLVRPGQLAWEPLGTHGLKRKVLGFDPRDRHVTNLVDIPKGWKGGGIAHFHHAFEEVYILSGSVTVGGRHYWQPGDYFYRPAHVVHGHDERSEQGCLCLIRSDGPLELLLIHEPTEPDEYPLQPITDPRTHVYSVPTATLPWQDDSDLPAGWRIRPLSADAVTGARTYMAQIPAGWAGAAGAGRPTLWEAALLEGSVGRFEAGDYSHGPAGRELFDAGASPNGAVLLVWEFPRDRDEFGCAPHS